MTFPQNLLLPGASLVAALGLCACGKKEAHSDAKAAPAETSETTSAALREVAVGKLALAKIEAENQRLDRALPLCLAAWEADAKSDKAAAGLAQTLCGTSWSFPVASFRFPFPVRQIAPLDDTRLLLGLGEEASTVVKWNTASSAIEGVLFPIPGAEIRTLIVAPTARRFVVERAGFLLLCDAETMKPIASLGALPADVIPQSTVVFSADGVLMAHPATGEDGKTQWCIRGTTDGGILRTDEAGVSPALAAHLDREGLTLLHGDGSRTRYALNPAETPVHLPLDPPEKLIAAVFSANGGAAMVLRQAEPNTAPQATMLDFGNDDGGLEPAAMLSRFPWSATPDVWSGLLREPDQALFRVAGKQITFLTTSRALVTGTAPVISFAHRGGNLWIGQDDGTLAVFRVFSATDGAETKGKPTAAAQENLALLTAALSGLDYRAPTHTFTPLTQGERWSLLDKVDFTSVVKTIPAFPAEEWENFRKLPRPPAPAPESIVPLVDRIARADATRTTWPKLLEKSGALTLTDWYRAIAARLNDGGNDPAAAVRATFAAGNLENIQRLLATLPESGPQAAAALELALASDHAEWIQAVLLRAKNVPPLLQRIAASRIALLENRPADALEGWSDPFPEIAADRRLHDWDGWEEADFSPALTALRDRVTMEIAAITLPPDATAEQRAETAARLAQPETLRTLGNARFTAACTAAAEALGKFPENAENALTLTELAIRFGGENARVLRAGAVALGTLRRFPEARDRWVKIISEMPREQQNPNDYAEAAYTAYESQNPSQAMEILTTGTHRYPQDADFALRAGWIALLTGESGQAYRFLVIGRQIGYAPEKEENATALLTIAAARAGAPEDSSAFRKELLRLNPRWNDPATLDALAWPEEFKVILRGQPAGPTAGSIGVLPEKPKQ